MRGRKNSARILKTANRNKRGSRPRVSGEKLKFGTNRDQRTGITPACAGEKRKLRTTNDAQEHADHPRGCGDGEWKGKRPFVPVFRPGTTRRHPRVCGGKVQPDADGCRPTRDHPARIAWEKESCQKRYQKTYFGITPAYAGGNRPLAMSSAVTQSGITPAYLRGKKETLTNTLTELLYRGSHPA